ncbi:MAG: DUF3887 domain-containing protein [Ruminococcaceae bacterium]|nr:DUF3887 domain-containing protein [Oscillospiraceae bacterium]
MIYERKIAVFISLLCLALLLTACGKKQLPAGFEKNEVINTAKTAVGLLNERDYDGVAAQFSSEMKELDAKKLEEVLDPLLTELGDFDKFTSESVSGANSSEIGDYAVAVLGCQYQNGTATYTISVDKAGRICGLYMK